MVKTKKTKAIYLTKTKKKGATLKKDLIQKIHGWVDEFDHIFVVRIEKKIKTTQIQQMREEWKPQGRFTFGKNKVVIVALGKKPEDEYHTNLHLLSSDIKGDTAVLFTSQSEKEVREYLDKMKEQELPITLQAIWKKDGGYKTFRKSKDEQEEMED